MPKHVIKVDTVGGLDIFLPDSDICEQSDVAVSPAEKSDAATHSGVIKKMKLGGEVK